jgi:hypothetical protein
MVDDGDGLIGTGQLPGAEDSGQLPRGRPPEVMESAHLGRLAIGRGPAVRPRGRVLVVGGAAVAAVCVAVVLALGSFPQLLTAPAPQQSPTVSPADPPTVPPTVPTGNAAPAGSGGADPATGTTDPFGAYVDSLPLGSPLAPAFRAGFRNGRLVVTTADGEVELPPGIVDLFDPIQVPSGWVFWGHSDGFTGGGPDDGQELFLLRPGRRLTVLHRGPFDGMAVSPDPTRFEYALAELTAGAHDPVRVVVRTLAGTVVAGTTQPVGTQVSGWTVRGVLLSRAPSGAEYPELRWWVPGRSPGAVLPYQQVITVPGDPGTVVVSTVPPPSEPSACWRALALGSGALGPKVGCSSAGNGATVGPDGHYLVLGSTVYDLRTGATGPDLLHNLTDSFTSWQDGIHVFAVPISAGGASSGLAFVRCDVTTGACERAPFPVASGMPISLAWVG